MDLIRLMQNQLGKNVDFIRLMGNQLGKSIGKQMETAVHIEVVS